MPEGSIPRGLTRAISVYPPQAAVWRDAKSPPRRAGSSRLDLPSPQRRLGRTGQAAGVNTLASEVAFSCIAFRALWAAWAVCAGTGAGASSTDSQAGRKVSA